MTFKQKALKGLVILVVVLGVSMFFSRTIQTITTPKVQKISASRGKLEEKIPFTAQVDFLEGEAITIDNAAGLGAVAEKVTAKSGYSVKEGDLLLTFKATEYDSKMKPLKEEYMKGVRETTERIAKSIRIRQHSEHNDAYNDMIHTADAYFEKRFDTLTMAVEMGYDIDEDIDTWGTPPTEETENKKTTTVKKKPDEAGPEDLAPSPKPVVYPDTEKYPGLKEKMQETYKAYLEYIKAKTFLNAVYRSAAGVKRVGDGTFDYIKERDGLIEKLFKKEDEIIELEKQRASIMEIRAPRDGFLTKFEIKTGDSYDGVKPLYYISQEGDTPMLKCDITSTKKTIKKGMKVSVEGVKGELNIDEIRVDADSKKYAYIKLSEKHISQLGGLASIMNSQIPVQIIYKADKTTTLIPASAVRTDTDGSTYVFTIERSWGGLLSNASETVKKMSVKVIEKSDKLVALEDDLSYQDIADNEDRTIKDGQQVMEYVD
ncbi:MAG: hypothetical protein GX337_06505 [Christensenellaceae bacterium]|nr:hypothetical protein [Christensenellaceae bacterium]